MDPLFYSSPTNGNGVPSESKLATYMMNRNNVTTPTYGNKVSLDPPLTFKSTQVASQSPEFISTRLSTTASPNFYSPYTSAIGGITPTKHSYGKSLAARSLLRNESPQSSTTSPRLTPQPPSPPTTSAVGIHQENVGGTTYFYPAAANMPVNQTNSSLNDNSFGQVEPAFTHPGHFYPGPSSNVINIVPLANQPSFFISDELRNEIITKNEIINFVDTENNDHLLEVDNYSLLCLLETMPNHQKTPLPTSTYKATHNLTGIKYCLRRLHGFRLQSTKCMHVVDMWKKIQHPNVVQLREVFTTKAFGDNSLVLVYDYHPNSQTLLKKYFTPISESNGYSDPAFISHKSSLQRSGNGPLLPENEIWSIIMQITAGLRTIHASGLACRTLDPTKIVLIGKRIRLSFLGISDIISFDPNQTNTLSVVTHYQQEDLTSLGKLILALACRCLQSVHRDQLQNSIDLVARHYSADLRNFIVYLLANTRRSVTEIMPMIGARFYTFCESLQNQCDVFEDELAKEMENGRLYRLLVRLNTINERPELNLDVNWSETGDRYMLKLFRDYLFHSVTADGRPWLDHAHIVRCLNKLDAGTQEKVQLMSRDEQSILLVTYAELKHCLEQAFEELTSV